MNEPTKQKFFGEQVPPVIFWVLTCLFGLAIANGWPLLVMGMFAGLALGTYFVWGRKHGSSRRITYSEDVLKKAGLWRR